MALLRHPVQCLVKSIRYCLLWRKVVLKLYFHWTWRIIHIITHPAKRQTAPLAVCQNCKLFLFIDEGKVILNTWSVPSPTLYQGWYHLKLAFLITPLKWKKITNHLRGGRGRRRGSCATRFRSWKTSPNLSKGPPCCWTSKTLSDGSKHLFTA